MNPQELRRYLEFYRDLGVKDIWRRTAVAPAPIEPPSVAAIVPEPIVEIEMKRKPADIILPSLTPENDTLAKISEDIGDCKRCRLCQEGNRRGDGRSPARARQV